MVSKMKRRTKFDGLLWDPDHPLAPWLDLATFLLAVLALAWVVAEVFRG